MKTYTEWLNESSDEEKTLVREVIKNLPQGVHYCAKCSCGDVMEQCRCNSPDRITIIFQNACDKCKKS